MNKERHYHQLSIEEREEIQALLADGYSRRAIGERLGRSHSSIVRELQKNRSPTIGRYTPRLAQERTQLMRQARGQRQRLKERLIRDYVEEKLRIRWSPEQIAGRLPRDHPGHHISHEAVYQYIYSRVEREGWGVKVRGEDLRPYLRRSHRRRSRKNVPFPSQQGRIRNRTSIEERPAYIEKRRQVGHWEGDSMVSSQSPAGLNTLVERATGFSKVQKVADGGAAATSQAVTHQLALLPPHLRRTLTTDNGKEHSGHEGVTAELGVRWYFCHAYASHERGTNENTNGLIRDYFPKKTDFALITDERIQEVEDLLNDRPRKRLKYKTPREVFTQRGAVTG